MVIDTYKASYELKSHIFLGLVDADWQLTAENIRDLNTSSFRPLAAFDTLELKRTYIGKLLIRSKINTDLHLALYISNASIQEFYFPTLEKRLRTGAYVARNFNDELFYNSAMVSVPVQHDTITEIYFTFVGHRPILIAPKLHQPHYIQKELKSKELRELNFRYFFSGAFLLLLLISAFAVVFSRKRAYFFYSLYILFVGFINQSFKSVPEFYSLSGKYLFLFDEFLGSIAWVAYMLFLQNFLHTKRNFPFLHKITNLLIGAVVVFVVMILVLLGWKHDVVMYLQYRNIYTLLIFLLTLPTFVGFVWSKQRLAVIIGSGGLITITSWIIYLSLQVMGHKDYNIIRTGQLFEVLLYGVAIAIQIAEVYKENDRIQKDIITQKENINRDLEQKVYERTIELSQRNAELLMQSEEIQTQNEMLQLANEEITSQKEKIELTYRSMTSSVKYAERIQNAVLNNASVMTGFFSDFFLFNEPKDIVSGDFYYLRTIENKTFLAVADCTGHGIPGAFMSILGFSLLDEIIRLQKESSTNRILNELREQVKLSLAQEGKIGEPRDGLDIALCIIDNDSLELQFSGALRPCWIYRKNTALPTGYELIVLEPDRMPIGIYRKEKPFSAKTIQLQKEDLIYLFSDGYYSQLDPEGLALMKTRGFKNLIQQICDLPLSQQKDALKSHLSEWKGTRIQTDDILVLAAKI